MNPTTQCNYCTLQAMKALAQVQGVEVVIGQERRVEQVWITVRYSNKAKPSAWFMSLTDHCAC